MRLAGLALLAVTTLGALAGACVGAAGTFPCEESSQCVQGGTPGTCEAVGFCSFPDPTCPSGNRYASHASEALAATCTGTGPGETDGGGGDGSPPTDDSSPARCGGTSLIADTFDDGVRSEALWGRSFDEGSPPLLSEQGGRVFLTYAADRDEATYAEYRSTATYDLRGDRVFVEVLNLPSTASGAQANLGITLGDERRIDLVAERGDLRFLIQEPGQVMVDAIILTAAHRWWQLRESGGTIFFETSEDGLSFVTRAMVAAPFDVSNVIVLFGGGTYGPELNPGTASFDNLNGGTPRGTACPSVP